MVDSGGSLDDVLCEYFYSWRPYKTILVRLRQFHGIRRSLRWLKYQFERLGLRRRSSNSPTPLRVVKNCIMHCIRGSGSLIGYRWMWMVLRKKYKLNVTRRTVMWLLREIDRDGAVRRGKRKMKRRVYISKGPNNTWHIDQYDKLVRYGFYIHGCIDGFSRKIIWLKVSSTNRNPSVTLGFYLEAVKELNGCPETIRVDKGVENTKIADCQIALRLHHLDDHAQEKSVYFGSSPSNSRIESWWSKLRVLKSDWWIQHFKCLERDGYFDPTLDLHKWCMAYAFFPALKHELEEFVALWNSHTIRKTRLAASPSGRPDDLYDMPELFGGEDCVKPVVDNILDYAESELAEEPPPCCPPEFEEFCCELVTEAFGISIPDPTTNIDVCTDIYKYLIMNITLV